MPAWQVPAFHVGDGGALVELARQQGLPGVVAKRLDSPYVPGARSPGLDRGPGLTTARLG